MFSFFLFFFQPVCSNFVLFVLLFSLYYITLHSIVLAIKSVLPPPWSDLPGLADSSHGRVRLVSSSGYLAVTIRCFPLPLGLSLSLLLPLPLPLPLLLALPLHLSLSLISLCWFNTQLNLLFVSYVHISIICRLMFTIDNLICFWWFDIWLIFQFIIGSSIHFFSLSILPKKSFVKQKCLMI